MRSCFVFVFFLVWAGSYDFSACQRYYKDASASVQGTQVVQIEHKDQKYFIGYFKTAPKGVEIVKADPFIGLYALNLPAKNKQSYMLMPIDAKALSLNVVGIGGSNSQSGIILEPQKGFLHYGRFSGNIPSNGVISNICYQIYGLGMGGHRFIDTRYLLRFLDQEFPYYGDIGVRLYPPRSKTSPLRVQYVDPFFPNVPFLREDEILSINGNKLKDYYDFEWTVSNLKENSIAKIEIQRGEKKLNFDVVIQRRYGGFLLPDIFFERIGIILNDRLEIVSTDPEKYKMQQGLVQGDAILWINGQKIFDNQSKSPKEIHARLKYLLTQAVSLGKLDILISRDNFQFTLNLINGLDNAYFKARYNPFGF